MFLWRDYRTPAAGRAAEYSEVVLKRPNFHIAEVQEIGGAPVRTRILLLNLEPYGFRTLVAPDVIDRRREVPALGMPRPATAPSRSDVNVAIQHRRGK